MEIFNVILSQNHIVEYLANIEIEAETFEEAIEIAKTLSQDELESRAQDWEQADDIIQCTPHGEITVTGYEEPKED